MGKRLLNLYVEDGDVEIAKSKGIVLSSFFRECLNLEITKKDYPKEKLNEKEQIRLLNNQVALMSVELNKKTEQLERIKKTDNKFKGIPFPIGNQK